MAQKGFYDRFIKTTTRLIKKTGDESCTWYSKEDTPPSDADKPWEGDTESYTPYPVTITFVPSKYKNNEQNRYKHGSLDKDGVYVAYMTAEGLTFTPKMTDYMKRSDGSRYNLEALDLIAPDGTPIMWEMDFIIGS